MTATDQFSPAQREVIIDECAQYVQDNVTDLASAKEFLKKVAAVLSVLSKEM